MESGGVESLQRLIISGVRGTAATRGRRVDLRIAETFPLRIPACGTSNCESAKGSPDMEFGSVVTAVLSSRQKGFPNWTHEPHAGTLVFNNGFDI